MPLKPSQLLACLQAKQADFHQFDQTALRRLQQYRTALGAAANQSMSELVEGLNAPKVGNPGAFPLEPVGDYSHWVLPSKLVWANREQSLQWVRDRLTGVKTFAVDGSQIFPGKDVSIPVALVQVGWFENLHLPTGGYTKDIRLDVLTPTDLQSSGGQPVDRLVNLRRFQMETQRLIDYMEEHSNDPDCLVFLDGSLVATFAETFDADVRDRYVACLHHVLAASEQNRVPLVAYIDTSYARDLTVMLERLMELPEATAIHDAQLLNAFMQWGDRTLLFQCRRSGILSQYDDQQHNISFTYLKTTREAYPVRLEFPRWIYDAGRLDQIVDWVRGEVIIGNGYPYAIETADQVAVLQADDRQTFYRILQDWAEEQELKLRFSRKMVSKARRR